MEYLYRYYSYSTNREMRFIMDKFEITKRTKCGVWIDSYGAKKFVNQNARKQWACVSEEKARHSFILRKRRQIQLLSAQLHNAEWALDAMVSGDNKIKNNQDGIQLLSNVL